METVGAVQELKQIVVSHHYMLACMLPITLHIRLSCACLLRNLSVANKKLLRMLNICSIFKLYSVHDFLTHNTFDSRHA